MTKDANESVKRLADTEIKLLRNNETLMTVGMLVFAYFQEKWLLAEIIDFKMEGSEAYCYVHFLGEDFRFDDWVQQSGCIRRITDFREISNWASEHNIASVKDADDRVLRPRFLDLLVVSKPVGKLASTSPSPISPPVNNHTMNSSGVCLQYRAASPSPDKAATSIRSSSSLSLQSVHNGRGHHHYLTIKMVRGVEIGESVRLQAWYSSAYPTRFYSCKEYLKLCDVCLSFFKSESEIGRHLSKCTAIHPPGREIYRSDICDDDLVSVFEVEGSDFPAYCERLLLLSKLFLEEKRAADNRTSQTSQVRAFTFYVLVRWKKKRSELVGYFSKMKSDLQFSNILSCILVLPHMQAKGFGKFLIRLSYELAARENRRGSAERPLSSLGRLSYTSFWSGKIFNSLLCNSDSAYMTLAQLEKETGIICEDLVECLRDVGLLREWGRGVVLLWGSEAIEVLKRASGKSEGFPFDAGRLLWSPKKVFPVEISSITDSVCIETKK